MEDGSLDAECKLSGPREGGTPGVDELRTFRGEESHRRAREAREAPGKTEVRQLTTLGIQAVDDGAGEVIVVQHANPNRRRSANNGELGEERLGAADVVKGEAGGETRDR
jgi:hypothetical protein